MSFISRKIGVLAFSILLVGLITVEGQKPLAVTSRPFEPVEELYYDAEFNRALLRGLNVAEFKLRSERTPLSSSVSNDDIKKDPLPFCLAFSADIVSKGFFTKLFNLKVHEQIESQVDASSFTLQKTTILDEQGKRVRTTETLYDRSTGKMSWTQRDPNNPNVEPRTAVVDFAGQLQDVLSAIYFLRTQPLQVGKTVEVFVGESGRVWRIPVQVIEKKKIRTVVGQVSALRVEPELFGPDNLIDGQQGQFTIWITDDQRRIPISARIKTDYGTFDIKLKRVIYNPPS